MHPLLAIISLAALGLVGILALPLTDRLTDRLFPPPRR